MTDAALLQKDCDAANLLLRFLARRDVTSVTSVTADLIVVCGSSVLATVYLAVRALQQGTPALLITGGSGHSTVHLYDSVRQHPLWRHLVSVPAPAAAGRDSEHVRSEAAVLADICRALGVTDAQLLPLEEESRNCGGNAEFSKKMVDRLGLKTRRVIMIQDPTMQLRTHASFTKWWTQEPPIEIISFSPLQPQLQLSADGSSLEFVPASVTVAIPGSEQQLQALAATAASRSQQEQQQRQQQEAQESQSCAGACLSAASAAGGLCQQQGVWGVRRCLSLLLGEVPRLRDAPGGYGPSGYGFIDSVEVGGEVEAAFAWLAGRYPELLRP